MGVESHCLNCRVYLSLLLQYKEIIILLCVVCILGLASPTFESFNFLMQESIYISLCIFFYHSWVTCHVHVSCGCSMICRYFSSFCSGCCPGCPGQMPRTRKRFICIFAPKCWLAWYLLIKTGLIICSCIQLDSFTYKFLAIFPQHLYVDILITSVKIDKDNAKIICIYTSASFEGPQCNASIIHSQVLEFQGGSHLHFLDQTALNASGHKGF